ncbi:MAG: DUF4965 domain-containing protein [Clostridia bacterium]|nr:DUF4965 domain-containing protein [Clostridia bacterium]
MATRNRFRPSALPLVPCDPYFSLWCFADRLTDDSTRHWTGRRQSAFGMLKIDGKPYRFMGKTQLEETYYTDGPALRQSSVRVTPTSTVFLFTHPLCRFKLTFLTPALPDRPEVFSRPVTYVSYEITPREAGHSFEVWFDVSAEFAGDFAGQKISVFSEPGHAWLGDAEQNPLTKSGDDLRIDWGYLHLLHPNVKPYLLRQRLKYFKKSTKQHYPIASGENISMKRLPLLVAVSEKLSDVFVLAYDGDPAIEYFGEKKNSYSRSYYGDFNTLLATAVKDYPELVKECAAFDKELTKRMKAVSPEYAKLGALAWRQVFAAHKLIEVDGKLVFLSKECFSNGCVATLDVTYPSSPLFLEFNPEFVLGMLRPLFRYARSDAWPFDFAPHDCGTYPLCNGQVYGWEHGINDKLQMPVEECGNAILMVAAVTKKTGDRSFAEENRDLLTKWADYLSCHGYDPKNQLCTDDFAGHLPHNCNLSLKAIVALGAAGKLYSEKRYTNAARRMAERWQHEAKRQCGPGYRLAFDKDDSWSLKYNLVWDKLLGLSLFPDAVGEAEVALYREKYARYGTPLDCRATYTKPDWLAFTTLLTKDKTYANEVYRQMERAVSETPDRVPFCDYYDTVDARQWMFQGRSTLGALFINLLEF